ncbi:MAG: DUF6978 family protein [Bacillota bacterium]
MEGNPKVNREIGKKVFGRKYKMLTQFEADTLIAISKKRCGNQIFNFPWAGETLTIPVVSIDEKESFLIDINRGRIKLTKCTYQERHEGIIILVRLDVDGRPHTNPDVLRVPLSYLEPYNGQTIGCPHLHLYVEGFMDKWAIPAPPDSFSRTNDLYETLYEFFSYCNIIEPPIVQRGLFI